jgi:hypothetical protein
MYMSKASVREQHLPEQTSLFSTYSIKRIQCVDLLAFLVDEKATISGEKLALMVPRHVNTGAYC